jgi:hypothetical protein
MQRSLSQFSPPQFHPPPMLTWQRIWYVITFPSRLFHCRCSVDTVNRLNSWGCLPTIYVINPSLALQIWFLNDMYLCMNAIHSFHIINNINAYFARISITATSTKRNQVGYAIKHLNSFIYNNKHYHIRCSYTYLK